MTGYSPDLTRRSTEIAAELLGAELTSTIDGASVTVRLTEVEAYEGADDPASHAYRGPTGRNAVMFGPAGHLYVYRHLGLHHCMNLVVGADGVASALLLRAGQVVAGQDTAWRRRNAAGVCRRSLDLARGPGRLTVALGITHAQNGQAVLLGSARRNGEVTLQVPHRRSSDISTGARVGVGGVGADEQRYPWRYWLTSDEHVSQYRLGSSPAQSSATGKKDRKT